MTDILKVAEAKVVDVIVKRVTEGTKQSKIPTKATKRTKEPTVSKKSIKKTKPTIQSKLDVVKTTPKKRSTRISIKTVATKKEMSNVKGTCKIDHSDVGIFKEEADKKYCNENGDLYGVVCASCQWNFVEKEK